LGSIAAASNPAPAKPSGIVAAIRGTLGSITSTAASVTARRPAGAGASAPVAGTSTSSRPPDVTCRTTPVGLKWVVNRTGVSMEGLTVIWPAATIHSYTRTVPGRYRLPVTKFEVATKSRPAATAFPAVNDVRKEGTPGSHRASGGIGMPVESNASSGPGETHRKAKIRVRTAKLPGTGSIGYRPTGTAEGTSTVTPTGGGVGGSEGGARGDV